MPAPQNNLSMSPAVNDLGLGDMLGEQVAGETAEARKKRMQQMQLGGAMPSLATTMLLGGPGSAGTR